MKSLRLIFILIAGFISLSATAQVKKIKTNTEKIILENDKVKVTSFESMPGGEVCGKGMHTHPAHLTVVLTDAEVKRKMPDGKIVIQKLTAGTTFWSEAGTHDVHNIGKKNMKVQLIDLK